MSNIGLKANRLLWKLNEYQRTDWEGTEKHQGWHTLDNMPGLYFDLHIFEL
jgi:hypothetical protein